MARSYYAWYKAKNNHELIGAVKEGNTSRFAKKEDAELRISQIVELNGGSGRVEYGIYESDLYPEIFPHCEGAVSQAISGKCNKCGEVITEKMARLWSLDGIPAETQYPDMTILKGNNNLIYKKGDKLTDVYVRHEGSGNYRVAFIHNRKRRSLSARFVKQDEFNMNNGDPTKTIRVKKG